MSQRFRRITLAAILAFATSPALALRTQPTLPVSIDAALLAHQKPAAAVASLKTQGWSQVTYNPREGLITLKSKDGSSGLVQYRKGVLLFAGFNVPSRPAVTVDLVRVAFRFKHLPPPTQEWSSGLRWQLHGSSVREIEGVVTNVDTHFGVKYAPESLIKQWESEG